MTLKDINFSVAMYGTTPTSQSTYQVGYTGDESSINVKFTVTDEANLAGATAKVHLYFADSSHIVRDMALTGLVFNYTLVGTENDHAGVVRADIIITKGGAKYTRAGYKFRIDTSLEASKPLVEYVVDTLDTLVDGAEEWLLQAQTDFGTAQGQRADEWVADNDTRDDAFTTAQASRATAFEESETARTSTFNTNETGRSNTFTTNENARQAAAEGGEIARDASYMDAEANRDSQFTATESIRSDQEAGRVSAESARVTAEAARVTEYNTLADDLVATLNAADANIENFDIALQTGIIGENITAELQNLEATYAPNIVSLTSQLADINLIADNAEVVATTAAQKADAMASGSPKGVYATLALLQAAFPTGNTGAYLVTADGKWYYWSGSAWTAGGTYQSTGIGAGAILPAMLSDGYDNQGRLDTGADLNNVYRTGAYYALAGCANKPTPTDGYMVIVNYIDARYCTQMAIKRNDSTKIYWRSRDNTVPTSFTAWTKLWVVGDQLIANGSITNALLADGYQYVSALTTEDLNTLTKDGTYLATAGLPNRPSASAASSAYIKVTPYGGSSYYQEYMQYSDPSKKWFRTIKPSNSDYGTWTPINTTKASSVLADKTIACFGDSITARGYYQVAITAKTAMIAPNIGFGGTRMAYHTDPNYDAFSACRLADAIVSGDWSAQDVAAPLILQEANLITLKSINFAMVDSASFFYGTNDFSGGIDLGTIDDINKTTFYGSYNYTLDKLLTAYPNLKIILFTPMYRNIVNNVLGNDSDDYPNGDGVYLKAYADAVVALAKKWHVPCYNLYDNCGINSYNASTFLADGLHFNELGGALVGRRMGGFIDSNI